VFVNALRTKPLQAETMVVVKRDEIGDVIYALHCFDALRTQFPNAQIWIYCKSMNVELLENCRVFDHIVLSSSELPSRCDIWLEMRGDYSTLWRALFSGCSYFLDRGTIRLKQKLSGGQAHEKHTNWEIIRPLLSKETLVSFPTIRGSQEVELAVDKKLTSNHIKQFVVVHVGARDASRRWPTERYAEVIDFLSNNFQRTTILVGHGADAESGSKVMHRVLTQNTHNWIGETSLLELNELMKRADLFIGNESGPLHFAVINKTPLIALFGPGVKDVFYPFYPNQVVLHHFKEKGHKSQTEANSTILLIQVLDVQNEIDSLLKKTP
jgi:ADP-heptose:LPS heptosyltransferase